MAKRPDRGSATAEAAVLLPVLLLLLAVGAGVTHAYAVQLRVQDAAKVAARAAARGDPDAEVRRLASAVGPPGVDLRLSHGDGLVRVDASAALRPPGGVGHLLPTLVLRAAAVAGDER